MQDKPIIKSQLRNSDYSITQLAKDFGKTCENTIEFLFQIGERKGLSYQDINTVISYIIYMKYSDKLYDTEIKYL